MTPLRTRRLQLREAVPEDAGFMLELLNEPAWRRFIGQHEVDSLDKAAVYVESHLQPAYREGLGFQVVTLGATGQPLGLCGLIRRPFLDAPDLGFALLQRHWGQGYAREAALAVLEHASSALALPRLLAITNPGNVASVALLTRLGFDYQRQQRKPDSGERIDVYARDLPGQKRSAPLG